MILSCPSCAARYQLADEHVTDRGARITCPRCSEIFVVYPGEGEPDPPLPPEQLSEELSSAPSADPAPPDAELSPPEEGETSSPGDASEEDEGIEWGDYVHRSADSVDFREVGISSWNVRVKGGFKYDFPDIRTLQKYMNDGRFTSEDHISPDGETWTVIGDIPDLNAYFLRIYDRALAAGAKPLPTREEIQEEESPLDDAALAEAMASAMDFEDQLGTSPVPSTPTPPRRRKSRPKKKEASSSSSKTTILVALAVVALAVWGLSKLKPEAAPAPAPAPAPEVKAESEEANPDLRAEILKSLEPIPAAEVEEAEEEERERDPSELKPVRPSNEELEKMRRQQSGFEALGSDDPQPGNLGATSIEQANQYYAQRNFSAAARGYAQAGVGGDPTLILRYGVSLYHSEDKSGAERQLRTVASTRPEALKYLAYIQKDFGDVAQSMTYFNQYLATNPPDAAQIQSEMRQLTGQ